MHDPSTLAFQIKRPWPQGSKIGRWRYWPSLVDIWHIDPEHDGSDDSCGWSYVKVPKAIVRELEFDAGCEARSPWLLRDAAKQPLSVVDAERKLTHAILLVARRCKIRCSHARAERLAVSLIHNPVDNLRSSLCFLPGWHSNFDEDRESDRKDSALSLYVSLARILLTDARPWWKHPRWHFWHWKINVQPVQAFKRWAWSRCCKCGGRFTWGYAPVTNSWHGTGPRWFASEPGVYHADCDRPSSDGACAADDGANDGRALVTPPENAADTVGASDKNLCN